MEREREGGGDASLRGQHIPRGSTVTKAHAISRMGSVKSRRRFAERYTVEPTANSQHSRPLMFEEIEKMRRGSVPSSDCILQIINLKIPEQ